jgi:hypothetical protein
MSSFGILEPKQFLPDPSDQDLVKQMHLRMETTGPVNLLTSVANLGPDGNEILFQAWTQSGPDERSEFAEEQKLTVDDVDKILHIGMETTATVKTLALLEYTTLKKVKTTISDFIPALRQFIAKPLPAVAKCVFTRVPEEIREELLGNLAKWDQNDWDMRQWTDACPDLAKLAQSWLATDAAKQALSDHSGIVARIETKITSLPSANPEDRKDSWGLLVSADKDCDVSAAALRGKSSSKGDVWVQAFDSYTTDSEELDDFPDDAETISLDEVYAFGEVPSVNPGDFCTWVKDQEKEDPWPDDLASTVWYVILDQFGSLSNFLILMRKHAWESQVILQLARRDPIARVLPNFISGLGPWGLNKLKVSAVSLAMQVGLSRYKPKQKPRTPPAKQEEKPEQKKAVQTRTPPKRKGGKKPRPAKGQRQQPSPSQGQPADSGN